MLIRKALDVLKIKSPKAQSFVELALVLPIVLLILLGLVEVAFYISRYLEVIDLTREAARFASNLDPQVGKGWVANFYDCKDQGDANNFNYYYATACIFAPKESCTDPKFCGGMNPVVSMNPAIDDVVISVYAVHTPTTGPRALTQTVMNSYPELYPANNPTSPPPGNPDSLSTDGYWAFSTRDAATATTGNWQKNCDGTVNPTASRHYTDAEIEKEMISGSPPRKGYVAVEFYYCYSQVLDLPILNWIVPNPLRIHAYSLMPLPSIQPYPTPTP